MAAMPHEQIAALSQCASQIEARDAATGASPMSAIASHNYCWPIKLLEHPGSHNAHHADVPWQLALDDYQIGLGLEFCLHGANNFLGDCTLDFLPLTVAGIEFLREMHRFRHVLHQ